MISENKTMVIQETLENAQQKAAALVEILFSIGETISGGSTISGDTITILGGIAKDIRDKIETAQSCME